MNTNRQLVNALRNLVTVIREQDAYPSPVLRDGKYSMEDAVHIPFNGKMQWVVAMENGMFRTADTYDQLAVSLEKRNAETASAVARMNADIEFRMEVVFAMTDTGIAKHVALNRTSTQATLMACAREFGVI